MQSPAILTERMFRARAEGAEVYRRLTGADRAAILHHLRALSVQDLEMRFGAAPAAPAIERHVQRIDFEGDIVLAAEDAAGALLGLAQVMRLPRAEAAAEVAFSVHPAARRMGVGTRLANVALGAARSQGMVLIVAQVCPRNVPMLTILRRAGMLFVREDGEMLGTLAMAAAAQPMYQGPSRLAA